MLKCGIFVTVIGALIGKQTGRNIEVMNSFELMFDIVANDIVIDMDYYNTKEEQCRCIVLYIKFIKSNL